MDNKLKMDVIAIAEDISQRISEFDVDNAIDFAYAASDYMERWVSEFQELFPDHDFGDFRWKDPEE